MLRTCMNIPNFPWNYLVLNRRVSYSLSFFPIVLIQQQDKNYVCIVIYRQDQQIPIYLNLHKYIPKYIFPTLNSITASPKGFIMVQNYSEYTPRLKEKPHIPQSLNLRVSHSNITPECCFRNFCQIQGLELVTHTSMINKKKINK